MGCEDSRLPKRQLPKRARSLSSEFSLYNPLNGLTSGYEAAFSGGIAAELGLTFATLGASNITKARYVSYLDDFAAGPINLTAAGDNFGRNISKRTDIDPDGFLDIVGHGDRNSVQIGTNFLANERQLAKSIQNSPQFTGQNIRLLSCNTGACGIAQGGSNSPSIAQGLANRLGVDVVALNNFIWANSNGSHFVAGGQRLRDRLGPRPTTAGDGMVRFTPNGQ